MATLNVRNVNPELPDRLRRAAGARGQTYSEFIEALFELHVAAMRRAVDTPPIRKLLQDVGLEEVGL